MSTNGVTEIQQGGIDQLLVKALSHPHRLHALKILNERTASPIQLAPIVGTTSVSLPTTCASSSAWTASS